MHKLNLLPKDIQLKKERRKTLYFLLVISCIFLVSIISSLFYFRWGIARLDGEINYLTDELNGLRSDTKVLNRKLILKDLKDRQEFYQKINSSRILWSSIIEDIMSKRPKDVLIDFLSADEKGYLVIKGSSSKASLIANFIDNLKKSSNTSEVRLNFIKSGTDQDDRQIYFFELNVQIKKD